jgi:hypothetical protein
MCASTFRRDIFFHLQGRGESSWESSWLCRKGVGKKKKATEGKGVQSESGVKLGAHEGPMEKPGEKNGGTVN